MLALPCINLLFVFLDIDCKLVLKCTVGMKCLEERQMKLNSFNNVLQATEMLLQLKKKNTCNKLGLCLGLIKLFLRLGNDYDPRQSKKNQNRM